jgi:hypothetical protein
MWDRPEQIGTRAMDFDLVQVKLWHSNQVVVVLLLASIYIILILLLLAVANNAEILWLSPWIEICRAQWVFLTPRTMRM